jgi:DNA polymerase-3 subunit delta'
VPLLPLYGHQQLRDRLAQQMDRHALPASILLHGTAGVGKQRLALWIAQRLLCEGTGSAKPCGECQPCRMVLALQHPDVHWVFPRLRAAVGADPALEDVQADFDEARQERAAANGLYAKSSGAEGIFIHVTRLLVQIATKTPALAKRKVLIVGDAERMVSQASSPEAANAFLKLLEEPGPDTTVIITSSEMGTLLPTIRSRVVAVRVAPLDEASVRAFLAEPAVNAVVPNLPAVELVRLAAGAPGTLIGSEDRGAAVTRAKQLLAAADGSAEQRLRAAFTSGSAKARGAFSDTLDALTVLVHDRTREAAARGDDATARRSARLVPAIEEAKRAAEGNANPQLVTAQLLETIAASSAGAR